MPSWTSVAGVLAELPGTSVENAPRMADFARVLAALDTVTGRGTVASYRAKVASLAPSLIEANTFAYAIYRLATLPSLGGLDPGPRARYQALRFLPLEGCADRVAAGSAAGPGRPCASGAGDRSPR